MDEWVARSNIEQFQKLLAQEIDDAKRQIVLQLLHEEELKLAAALKAKKERNELSVSPAIRANG